MIKICKTISALLIIFLSLPLISFPQVLQPIFYHYSVKEGLPSSEIYTVIQDSKGYLWFGTDKGVCRYDGYKFRNFGILDGLSDNTVFKIFEDKEGKIWFGTLSCRLSYFFNDSIYLYEFNNILKDTLPKYAIIQSFYIDNKNVYLGLSEHGCFKINKVGKVEVLNPHKGEEFITASTYIQKFDSGILAYSSIDLHRQNHNRIILASEKKILETGFYYNINKVTRFNICAIKTKSQNYFVATSNCLLQVDEKFNETFYPLSKEIISLYEDNSNNIWIGYNKGGIAKFGEAENSIPFLSDLSVSSIFQDHEGGYWFTTLEKGVFYIPNISIEQFSEKTNFNNIPATSLCNNLNGSVLVAFQDGTVLALSSDNYATTGKINFDSDGKKFQVYDFLVENPLKIWVGRDGYLSAIYPQKKIGSIELIPVPSRKIIFHDSTIWGAHHFGLTRFVGQELVYRSLDSVPGIRVNAIWPDSSGNFWIGSNNGLWKFSDGKFIYWGDRHPLLRFEINDIKSSEIGFLLATENAGLVIMNDDSIYNIGLHNGLSSKDINTLFIGDEGTVWAGTAEGISCINFIADSIIIQNISDRLGLRGLEISDITINGVDVLMAGKTGFMIIKQVNAKKEKYKLPLTITSIQVNYSDTVLLGYEELPYFMNSLDFSYKAISYKHNNTLKYKYRLLGLDSNWRFTANLSVLYPALPPGSYVFELTVTENPAYYNELVSFPFTILSPYWNTWWFYTGLAVLILSLIVAGFYLRIRNIVNKNKLLHDLNAAQHIALSSQMNPHFIFNSLNSIHNYILRNKSEESSKYLTKFAKLMRMVLNNSMEKFIPVEQEIKALNLFLELEAMRFKGKITYSIEIDEFFYDTKALIPPLLIQPYVENAIWHGLMPKKENGIVSIIIKKTEEKFICIVEDDGVGRKNFSGLNSNSEKKSLGTNITEKRIGLINSFHKINIGVNTVDLKSETGMPCGTRVEIILPLIS